MIIWAYSLKKDGFLPFLNLFSEESNLRVTLGDFTAKTQNWGRGESEFNWKSIK